MSRIKRSLALIMSILIMLMIVTPVIADSGIEEHQVFVPKKLNSVSLGKSSTAELVNAALIPTNNGKTLAVSIRYYNGGNSDLDLTNYWAKIRSKSKTGASYSVKLIPQDLNKTKLTAKNEYTLTYYSEVGSDAKLSDLIVDIVEWDLYSTSDSLEKRLGQITMSDQHFTVPAGHYYDLSFSGMTLGTLVKKSVINANEKYYNATLTFEITNNGKSTASLPQLQYYILTQDDVLYTLTPNQSANLSIAPKMDEEITLRANIPVANDREGWQLVVASSVSEGQAVLPLAVYGLSEGDLQISDDFDAEYSFTTLDGLFYMTVDHITRAPMDDQDVISAKITIENKGDTSLPMPALAGKYVLDDAIDAEAVVIQPNKVIAISPKAKVNVHMYAIIPYTFEFEDLKLVLQEQDPVSQEKSTLVEISGKNPIKPVQQVAANDVFSIQNVGSSSSYEVRTVRSYESGSSKRFVVQIDVTNLERRATDLLNFAGYVQTADGNVFPADIAEVNNKMTPGGKALLEVSTILPKHYNTDNATLIIGEIAGISEQQKMMAYVNPVEYLLPEEQSPQDNLVEIDLYPYKLSIHNIKSQVQYGTGQLTLDFKYDLEKDSLVQFNNEKKTVVIEVLDEKNDISFTNTYTMEYGQNDQNTFEIGSHEGLFSATDFELIFKLERMNNHYKVNVYEQYEQGFKKLLASKEIRWFATSD